MEELTEKILPEKVRERIKVLGDGSYPLEDGKYKVVVKDNVVVTVTSEDMK